MMLSRKLRRWLLVRTTRCSVAIRSLLVAIVLLLIWKYFFSNKIWSNIYCYELTDQSLPDISLAPPPKDKSIFFIDTTCISHLEGRLHIATRTCCMVEAAAKLHPDQQVYVLFTSPGLLQFDKRRITDRSLHALLTYENVNLHRIYYSNYTKSTPLENYFKTNILYKSPASTHHASHILRIVTLWRYGGIYLDTNELVLKSLKALNLTFLAFERDEDINTEVMGMSASFTGKRVLRAIMTEMVKNYHKDQWYSSGSVPLRRAVTQNCRAESIRRKNCEFVKLYKKELFYRTSIEEWMSLFNETNNDMLHKIRRSYTLKTWNVRMTGKINDKMPYGKLAKKLCPRVYEVSEGHFDYGIH